MANRTQKKEVEKDIGTYQALEALKNSEGGRILIASLQKDILSCIDILSSKYKELTHTEMIALSARLGERLTLFRTISRSSKNKKLAKETLDELLKETEEEST